MVGLRKRLALAHLATLPVSTLDERARAAAAIASYAARGKVAVLRLKRRFSISRSVVVVDVRAKPGQDYVDETGHPLIGVYTLSGSSTELTTAILEDINNELGRPRPRRRE